ncbi:hypothetical protein VNO80_06511 [Phaseolus coccineus]|uniref:Uncharacterized protein n=1 Tax=Phaseolus coccineus TaxID=3886 RepID=A0AAN9RIS7_PHACN
MTEPLSVGAIQTLSPLNDPEGTFDWSDLVEDSFHRLGFDWVDPKVTGFTSVYRDSSSISAFVDKYNILKLDANHGILAVDYCHPADTICIGIMMQEAPQLGSVLAASVHEPLAKARVVWR